MAISTSLRYLLTAGSLLTAVLAKPVQKVLDEDEEDDTPLPLVIWHGLGDNYAAEGLHSVGSLAESIHPGTLVYYVRMSDDASSDRSATFFGNLTDHIAKACADIAAHPILSTAPAIDALGFSQGGQFLRGYVERCNNPPVRSLVTFGSQHNGISAFRECPGNDWLCKGAMALLRGNAWSSFVQNRLVPAQYYRKPDEYERYLQSSNFLADINNERIMKNQRYKENIKRLENLVLYMFEDDTTVIPKETAWFEEVNGTEVTPLRARKMYREDWLGLRELDRKGRLHMRTTPGDHMQLSEKVLNETFTEFFGPLKKKGQGRGQVLGDGDL
ncbi:palmitoyl-protein thioesterase [Diplogelasinospora grovesii]|uniref:Palmitoyl-protein thioesterase 1 n=1 Tax=Diplogelasinospora grovesii TaxID=303347 RepID=A0AAN6NCS4_9PEZI|nr:palmitoyl-protein thioesterase [Diplogelasinospora grovesii]